MREVIKTSAEKYGDKAAYKYFITNSEIKEISYNEVYSTYNNIGASICSEGLMKTKIAILSENRPQWIMAYTAIIGSGSVVVPLDKELLPEQIENFINYAEIEAIFCSSQYTAKLLAMNIPSIKKIIDFDNSVIEDDRYVTFDDFCQKGATLIEEGYDAFNRARYDSSKMSALIFTSGTTGTSKGVMLSEDNIITALTAANNMIDLPSDTVLLSVLPMHHTYETTAGQLTALCKGVTICINNSLKYFMRNIKTFRPTAMVVVPLYLTTLRKRIADEIKKRKKENIINVGVKATKALKKVGIDARSVVFSEVLGSLGGRLKEIVCGGAAIDPETIEWFHNIGINVSQGYGITECAPLVAVNPLVTVHYNSVGVAIPGSKIKIIDDKDGVETDLPNGEIGEICVKGGHVMLGYYNDEDATKATFTEEGYFKTGDFGYIDDDGFIYITGRKKNIIVLDNGKNVYPEEIEEYLERIEKIKEVVVVGRKAEDGETVKLTAIVYPKADIYGENPDTERAYNDIHAKIIDLNRKLPSFKQIKTLEIRTEPFEKTTSRKIKRHLVK